MAWRSHLPETRLLVGSLPKLERSVVLVILDSSNAVAIGYNRPCSRTPITRVQNFTINWKDSFRLHQIGGYVKLDGTPCGGNTVGPAPLQAVPTPVTIQKSSVQTSMMTERPFLFSPLEMTGNNQIACYI